MMVGCRAKSTGLMQSLTRQSRFGLQLDPGKGELGQKRRGEQNGLSVAAVVIKLAISEPPVQHPYRSFYL